MLFKHINSKRILSISFDQNRMNLESNKKRKEIVKSTNIRKLSHTVLNNQSVKEEIKETSENIMDQRKIKTNIAKFMRC